MPSPLPTIACCLALVAFWTCLGLPITRRLFPTRSLALPLAPAVGWAVHVAVAFPVCLICGVSIASIVILSIGLLSIGLALAYFEDPRLFDDRSVPISPRAFAAALALALIPLAAVLPKVSASGVALAAPMFDHAKIAIVDEIARFGIPPTNPFFDGTGTSSHLAYYYLWHFSAAMVARVFGLDGWGADAALTGFTAFASLGLMMGLAVWHADRASAAGLVILLCLSGSLVPLLTTTLGIAPVDHVLSSYPGLAGWLVQASWVPQHLASGICVVLAIMLIGRLGSCRERLTVPVLVLLVCAGFGSSTWVGGIVFALTAPIVGLVVLRASLPGQRRAFLRRLLFAGFAILVLSFPLLRDQYYATLARQGGFPIGTHPYEVLGPIFPDPIRRWLDIPAYWLVLLPTTFPAIAAILAAAPFLPNAAAVPESEDRRKLKTILYVIAGASFATAWLFVSTIGNNDLGWRAILPGLIVALAWAASTLSLILQKPFKIAVFVSFAALASGLPDCAHVIRDELVGHETTDARAFEQAPELWASVRMASGPGDRIANNPLMLKDMLPWPVDISWALLSHRRSCFAGWELTRAYAALPRDAVTRLDAEFIRVFAGEGTDAEARDLGTKYGCDVIVITPEDGVWARDVFAKSDLYVPVESGPRWRIYKLAQPASGSAVDR